MSTKPTLHFRASPQLLFLTALLTGALIITLSKIPTRIQLQPPTNHPSTTSIPIQKLTPLHPSAITNDSCTLPTPHSPHSPPPTQPNLHPLLHDYLIFHSHARKCLANPPCQQPPNLLLATCSHQRGCAGLGDRLRGILFSFTIALLTKRAFFLYNLSTPFPLEAGIAPNLFDWTPPSTLQYNSSWPHLEWNWCKKGRKCQSNSPLLEEFQNFDDVGDDINMLKDDIVTLFDKHPVVTITSRNRYDRISFVRENPYLKQYKGLVEYLIKREDDLHHMFFRPSLSTVRMMKSVQFQGEYISVHIRTGVDAHETHTNRFSYWSTHETETVEQVFKCMTKNGRDIKNVFLASDSPNTKQIFLRKAKEKGYTVHLFDKKTAHYNRIKNRVGETSWDSLCEGFLTVFSDLFMLAGARVMIRTASHFSTLASSLANDQQVFLLQSPNTTCIPK